MAAARRPPSPTLRQRRLDAGALSCIKSGATAPLFIERLDIGNQPLHNHYRGRRILVLGIFNLSFYCRAGRLENGCCGIFSSDFIIF
jgi:hypothetical protein